MVSKTFGQDTLHHATPRKALGDVKNFTLQQSASAVKKAQQPLRKLASHNITAGSVSRGCSLSRSSVSVKPGTQTTVKVKEDAKLAEPSVPVHQMSASTRAKFLLNQEKEAMFPFVEKGNVWALNAILK